MASNTWLSSLSAFCLFSLLLLHPSHAIRRDDPQLKQCLRQCDRTQQDQRLRQQCKQDCIEQRHDLHDAFWSIDPQKQLDDCRRDCSREEDEQHRYLCTHRCDKKYGRREEDEEDTPYLFEEKHFRTGLDSEEGRVSFLQRFNERSDLLRGFENFRISVLEANPHALALPSHGDAEALLFIARGRGILKLTRREKVESVSVQCGDVVRVEAGTPLYTINTDKNEKLIIIKLFKTISVPGVVQEFFAAGGQDPESFYSAFSKEVLQAAFNVEWDKIEKVIGRSDRKVMVKASEEQVEALSKGGDESSLWPFGGETREAINLFKKKPTQSNQFGRLHEADWNDYSQLRDLQTSVSFANITQGAMAGPVFNSKAMGIAIILKGNGYFEMACPHGSSERKGSSKYEKISGSLSAGKVLTIPPGHPVAFMASKRQSKDEEGGLQIMCFHINDNGNVRYPLAGKWNVVSRMEKEAKMLAFGASKREVEETFGSQPNAYFYPGPEGWRKKKGNGGVLYY